MMFRCLSEVINEFLWADPKLGTLTGGVVAPNRPQRLARDRDGVSPVRSGGESDAVLLGKFGPCVILGVVYNIDYSI